MARPEYAEGRRARRVHDLATPASHLDHRTPARARQAGGKMSVDVHFHLLPGLDDGPQDLAESLELARAAVAQGTRVVVATPHVREDFVTDVLALPELVRELRAGLEREGVALEVRCGGELGHRMVGRLRQAELEAIAQGPPGARWVLLEAPFAPLADHFHLAAAELRDRGFGVVLAHPERSPDAALYEAAGLRREISLGALAQLNALSLTGGHGEDARLAAGRLVRWGLAAVVGSDAHGPTRPPALAAARRALVESGHGPELAHRLTLAGPRRLLARGMPAPAVLAA
jgi:protein-tyrosine phosphatase